MTPEPRSKGLVMIKELYSTALIFKCLRFSANLREIVTKRLILILIGHSKAVEIDLVTKQIKMEKRMME